MCLQGVVAIGQFEISQSFLFFFYRHLNAKKVTLAWILRPCRNSGVIWQGPVSGSAGAAGHPDWHLLLLPVEEMQEKEARVQVKR